MNLGYDLSLGDEGGNYNIDGDNFSLYEVRSVGANYNTMSLTVGYKFKLNSKSLIGYESDEYSVSFFNRYAAFEIV